MCKMTKIHYKRMGILSKERSIAVKGTQTRFFRDKKWERIFQTVLAAAVTKISVQTDKITRNVTWEPLCAF